MVPNGVDTSSVALITRDEKIEQKHLLGCGDHPMVLFIGSWHPPNLEALTFIINVLARDLPNYYFMVIGSIKDYYLQTHKRFPKNVLAFGVVEELEKYELYKLADIAINPMFSGSGTNLKMLDYMSAGIPVVATEVGARGLDIENGVHFVEATKEGFSKCITTLMNDDKLRYKLKSNSRSLVEDLYSWDKIAEITKEHLRG